MKKDEVFKEYSEIIKELAAEEVQRILREGNFYRAMTGTVLNDSEDGQSYNVDIIDTKLNNVVNKTGQKIPKGSTVTIMERYGSNYANSYISVVNGNQGNQILSVENGKVIVRDNNGNVYTLAQETATS